MVNVNLNFYKTSFLETHFTEIKFRAAYALFSLVLSFFCAYVYSLEIIFLLVRGCARGTGPPGDNLSLFFIFTDVTEAFYAAWSAAGAASVAFSLAIFCYQGWCFFAPSLYARERARAALLSLYATAYLLLVFFSILMALVPLFYGFFQAFSAQGGALEIRFLGRISPYLSWLLATIFYGLLLSLLPPALLACLAGEYWTVKGFIKNRKHSICFLIVCAGLLSPGDFLSQFVLAVFLFFTFECIIWVSLYKNGRKA